MPRGLTVKQIARRCELTVATTYHLVRTLAYEGYVIRREDGTYIVGLEIADRYRELVTAFRGPRRSARCCAGPPSTPATATTWRGFVGGRVAITAVGRGARSPYLEDLVPGFDDGAHATALGKALLATLTRRPAVALPARSTGMRAVHPATLTSPRGARGRPGRRASGAACSWRWASSGRASPAPRCWSSPTATWSAAVVAGLRAAGGRADVARPRWSGPGCSPTAAQPLAARSGRR